MDEDMDVDVDVESQSSRTESKIAIKERIFADVPVSRAQCEKGWIDLCAFVYHSGQKGGNSCWRPSAMVKLDVWKRVLEGAVLQGINLEKQFLVDDLWKAVLGDDDEESEEPFPRELFDAVLKRVSEFESGSDECPKCGFLLSLFLLF